jgi:hypothetical protein
MVPRQGNDFGSHLKFLSDNATPSQNGLRAIVMIVTVHFDWKAQKRLLSDSPQVATRTPGQPLPMSGIVPEAAELEQTSIRARGSGDNLVS